MVGVRGLKVYSGQDPISMGTWGNGVMKVRNGNEEATVLAMGRKCRKHWSNKGHSKLCTPTVRCANRDKIAT